MSRRIFAGTFGSPEAVHLPDHADLAAVADVAVQHHDAVDAVPAHVAMAVRGFPVRSFLRSNSEAGSGLAEVGGRPLPARAAVAASESARARAIGWGRIAISVLRGFPDIAARPARICLPGRVRWLILCDGRRGRRPPDFDAMRSLFGREHLCNPPRQYAVRRPAAVSAR